MNQRSRGYAMLLVLVALAFVSLLLTVAATRGLRAEGEADRLAAASARRWAVESATVALPPAAAAMLDAPEPAARRELTLDLGGVRLTARLDDEAAKFDVNQALRSGDPEQVARLLRTLSDSPARITPDAATGQVHGPGQVFADTSPAALAEATRLVTMYRAGPLDEDRAEPAVRLLDAQQRDGDNNRPGRRPGPPSDSDLIQSLAEAPPGYGPAAGRRRVLYDEEPPAEELGWDDAAPTRVIGLWLRADDGRRPHWRMAVWRVRDGRAELAELMDWE